jgi:hypothetical protein
MKGAADVFRQPLHLIHLCRPFRERAEDSAVIHLLKGFPVAVAARDLANKEDHRRRILPRDMDPCRRIGGPRAAGYEGHTGLAGQLACGLRHHRGRTFMPTDDIGDAPLIKPVECRQKALPRH